MFLNLRKRMRSLVVATSFVALAAASVTAQIVPNGSLWNTVNNPNGLRALPVVYFDPSTGILSMDTRGINRTIDTHSNTGSIVGDDVGMITLLVTGPRNLSVFSPFTMPFDPQTGLAWSGMYFGGKMQLLGNTIIGQYVPPGMYRMFQYPLGSALVGNSVEMAINFGPGLPGNVLNGQVQLVPEAGSLQLVITGLLGLGMARRA